MDSLKQHGLSAKIVLLRLIEMREQEIYGYRVQLKRELRRRGVSFSNEEPTEVLELRLENATDTNGTDKRE